MQSDAKRRHFGIVTQVYPPDPAAVGQHLADVAEELARRGYRVSVFTSDRGYDEPSAKYQRFERRGNVTIIRLPWTSFGKGSIASRLASGASLVAQASLLTGLDIRITDLLLSTIPHFVGVLGVAMKILRGRRFHYWLMDLNPDQIVAHGKLAADSMPVKIFDLLNRNIIRHASTITTLDDQMAQRFAAKSSVKRHIEVIPPWAVDAELPNEGRSQFRGLFGLTTERVIMHAGNHSVVHPLDTLVEAIRLRPNSKLKYFFVGGGLGKKAIEQWVEQEHPTNVTLLPYQPRERVPDMIRAADVHVVSVGNNTVGIVHPSKLYGALAAGRPVIVLGPRESPAAQLVIEHGLGWHVEHGDVEGMVRVLELAEGLSDEQFDQLTQFCLGFVERQLSRSSTLAQLCNGVLR